MVRELDGIFRLLHENEMNGTKDTIPPQQYLQHSYPALHDGEKAPKTGFGINGPKTFYKTKDILLNDLNRLIRCLEIYLSGCVKTEDNYKLPDIADLKIDRVISFNYTDTYKLIYHPADTVKYYFIHGKADLNSTLDDCNLVLGLMNILKSRKEQKETTLLNSRSFIKEFIR